MSLAPETLQQELEQALKALAQARGDGLARQLRSILSANLDRGRVQAFSGERLDLVAAYVWHVADGFDRLNPYLHRLQHERDASLWEPLFERMQDWAYNFLLRKGFFANQETRGVAVECATEAALNLLDAYFPYDTEFDPWAHIIVQNACRKFIDRAFRKSAVPEDRIVELDDRQANPADPLLELQALQEQAGEELQHALAQLSEARRAVIQLIYFDELEAAEAAQRLGKTVGAVYSLQFHALRDLRKILDTIRDSL